MKNVRTGRQSFRMVLLTVLLAVSMCAFSACCAKEKKQNASGEYKLYSMESGSDSYSHDDIVSYGLDSMTLILFEDGTGTMGFGDDCDEFTWSDQTISSGDEEIDFDLQDGMLTLSEDGETLVFERVGDAPKKAEISGNDTASPTDDSAETAVQ